MINKKYLEKIFIKNKIIEFQTKKPIGYIIFNNFIENNFYNKCFNEYKNNNYNILNIDNSELEGRKNKTIFIEGKNLLKLNNFLLSNEFENFLGLFFRNKLKREFYILKEDIEKKLGNKKGLLAQLYEKGDLYGWHVDGSIKGQSLGTFIYYFNSFDENNNYIGGELELGKGSWGNIKTYKTIKPKNNTLILLLYSEKAFHRVNKILSKDFKRISVQATLIKK